MLRYRGYDWALVPGESRIEVHLGHAGSVYPEPKWSLKLQYMAMGAEWRRCGDLDRPRMFLELFHFSVPPGDWRNLAEVSFWNVDEPEYCFDRDLPNPGMLCASFRGSFQADREEEDPDFGAVEWRVARAEGSRFTIELSADKDADWRRPLIPEMAGAGPGAEPPEPAAWDGGQDLYLLETLPFGRLYVKVPRNAKDPFAHAEVLARRALKTPRADHVRLHDFKDDENPSLNGDLHVVLHVFGYHDT